MVQIKTKSIYSIIAFFIILCVSLIFIGSSHAFSSSILYFSLIHITNSQNVSTTSPFQQMINLTINSTNSKYINQTGKYSFQNVEFFNTTSGAIIDSWLESYTAKYAIFWIKLPNGIPANTTLNDIAIGFAPNDTNLFNNKTTGEDPQLSQAYGEYDDGANVFNFYDNFKGTSLNTSKWSIVSGSPSNLFVDNGLEIINGSTIQSKFLVTPGILEENNTDVSSNDGGDGLEYVPISVNDSSIQENNQPYWGHGNLYGIYQGTEEDLNSNLAVYLNGIFGLWWLSNGDVYGYHNNVEMGSTTITNIPYSESYVGLYAGVKSGTGTGYAYYTWVLSRAYPPKGIMPSILIGKIQKINYTLNLNQVANSNSTIIYGVESNFTALSRNSSVFVRLFINNIKVTNYSKNSTTYLKYFSAGLYKVTAQYNSTSVQNSTYYEEINKAVPNMQLYSLPSDNYTQNGTYLRFNSSIYSLNNQLTAKFYLNKTNKVNTSTASDYNVSDLPNTYLAVLNTTGNQNYTAYSLSLAREIYTVSLYLNGALNSNSTITYGTESNFTAKLPVGYVRLFINNTKVTNYSKNSTQYIKYLAAGLYKITANTNLSGGENVSFYEKINKAVPSISIESSTGNFTYNGDSLNLTGLISTLNSQLTANDYINGKFFATTNTHKSYLNATAGTYKMIFNTTGNQNYTAYSTAKEVIISKAAPSYSLSGQSFTYDGKTTNISATISTVNNQLSATLYVKGVAFSTFNQDSSIYRNATAGSYSTELTSSGNENYSSFTYIETFTISKAEPSMECSDSPLVFLYNGSYFKLTCNISSFNNQLLGNLYLNNLTINSSKSSVSYKNNKVGSYTFIFKAGNENYSEKEINLSNSILGNLSFSLPLIKYFFPITISNYQSISAPSPFQQMVNINSSNLLWSYINHSGQATSQNLEFVYGNGTVIPSWLESDNTLSLSGYNFSTGSTSASTNLPSADYYLCAGGDGNGALSSHSWTDLTSADNYASLGIQNSSTCSDSSGASDIIVGGIALDQKYISYQATNYSSVTSFSSKFKVPIGSTDTILLGSCGFYSCNSIDLPPGCSELFFKSGGDNYETVFAAECQLNPGNYTLSGSLSGSGYVSLGAFYYKSNDLVYWIKLGSIPAGSSKSIYAAIAPNSTNLFNGNTVGEAPNLSKTYGEYDNGVDVFNNYWNFAGSSLPSGWTYYNAEPTINNGLDFANPDELIETTSTYPVNNILEGYAMYPTGLTANMGFGYIVSTSSNSYTIDTLWLQVGSSSGDAYSGIIDNLGDSNNFMTVKSGSDSEFGSASSGILSVVSTGSEAYGYDGYNLVYSDTNYVAPSGNYYIAIGSGGTSGLKIQWLRTRTYPPNGVMPLVEFGSEINVPKLSINNIIGNISGVYGNKSNITANDNSSNGIRILINNKAITSYHKENTTYFNYISGGLNKITVEENLSNSSNYINVTYYANISKKAISQSLTVYPNGSFYYDGIAPVITDKLNESLINGNIINYSLLNSSVYVTSLLSKNNLVNFSNISGKYASAGDYLFKVISNGNENYTIINTSEIMVNISKAHPILSIYTTPSVNYSNNETSLIFHFKISTINSQLLSNFYINNTLENTSVINGTYNASYQPNIFVAKLNTSGNENYTLFSIQKTMQIKLGKLYLYLNGFESNLTTTYPKSLNVSAYSTPSTLPINLYINNTFTASSNGSLHYLKNLAAGFYKITITTNSSGIANVSFYQKIDKAVPKLVLSPYYTSQIYDGSGIPVNLSISSVNNQLYYQLYINSAISFTDNSNVTYTTNASAGSYNIKLFSPGNQNYSGISISTALKIEKAQPILKLALTPDKSFYYNGTPLYLYGTAYSFNNQLSANLYINNQLKGKGYNINYSSSAPIKYGIVFETLGNDNYSSAFENFNLTIMNVTSRSLLTSKTKLFNQSVLNTVFNVSRLNYKEQVQAFRLFPSYNLSIPLPYNVTPVNELSMPVLSNLNGSVFTIYSTKNSSCFGNALSGVLYSFNDSVTANEGNFGEVTYLFSLHKNALSANNIGIKNISLYRCSETKHNWQEIPTFLVNANSTNANYKAVSPGFSQYVIAEGSSLSSAENSSLTVEYVYENGLPSNYRWNATINNVTLQSISGSPILTLVPYGQFKIRFYNLSSHTSNATYSCNVMYTPNIPSNSSLLGIAGIPVTVNYSVSTACIARQKPAFYTPLIEFKGEIIIAVVLIVALIFIMLFYSKRRKIKTRGIQVKKKRKGAVNKKRYRNKH
ncbi:DUF2341 domain-containing protein [Candidatus Parvarchaeota archaeon]|nr:DUF2341 domain-containing protein [Candidatus Parvarchaeota archaeon]